VTRRRRGNKNGKGGENEKEERRRGIRRKWRESATFERRGAHNHHSH